MEQIFEPCGFTTYKITTFENIDFGVTWPLKVTWHRKRKLDVISATARDRAKRRKFSNSVGLLTTKLQLFKNKFWVTWPLKVTSPQKLKLAIISETVIERAKRSKFVNPWGFTPYEITTLENIKVTWPGKCKLAIISLRHWVGRLWRGSSCLLEKNKPL